MTELEKDCLINVSQKMGFAVFKTAWRTIGESGMKEQLYIVTAGYSDADIGRMFRQLLEEVGAHDGQ